MVCFVARMRDYFPWRLRLICSAAFGTLGHSMLLKRLETTYDVRGTVLDWFVSYLSDRSQSVIFDGVVSASRTFVYGVPQGSVLGPVLFTFYFQLLSDVISDHICDYHKYADDTELSKNAPPDHFVYVQSCIQTYIDDILLWMNSNNLKLNTDKTEVMPVDCTSRLKSVDSECANIGGNTVPFKTSVKCLGVHVDRTLSVQQHISSISRASFLDHRRVASVRLYLSQSAAVRRVASVRLYLSQSAAVRRVASVRLYLSQSAAVRRVASVRLYLSQSAAAGLVAAMIISCLDYCNSVFTPTQIAWLQQVQNNAVRFLIKRKKTRSYKPR